jgi:hypothetical protein
VIEAAAGLERIKALVEQIVPAAANSSQQRTLKSAIRGEAAAYRKSLDTEQATAAHDVRPQAAVGPGSLNRTSASRKPTHAVRRTSHHSRRPPHVRVLKDKQDPDP